VAVESSEEVRPGVVLDFDDRGDVVSLEILDASRVISQADRMEFDAAGRCRSFIEYVMEPRAS